MEISEKRTAPQRNGKIELMRFVFSVIIAGYHLGCSLNFDRELFQKGYLAVEFFFMVSGFLLAKSLVRYHSGSSGQLISDSLRFMGKKYLSLYRYYAVVIVMTCIAWIPVLHLSLKKWLIKVLESLPTFLLVQMAGFRYVDWMVPVWYVSAMLIVMFILTPVLIRWGRTYSLYFAPVIALLLWGFIWQKSGHFNVSTEWKDHVLNLGLMRAFADISIGCTFFYIVQSGILKRFRSFALSAAGIFCYLIILLYTIMDIQKSAEPAIVFLTAAAVLVTFGNENTFRFLNNRFICFLGKASLPVFLCHSIARYYVEAYCPAEWGYYPLLGIFFGITFALSGICILIGDGLHWLIHRKKQPQKI